MKKIVDMINYEIEYVLRPHTAPARFSIPILVIIMVMNIIIIVVTISLSFELRAKHIVTISFKGKTLLPDSGQRKEQNPRER